jgi:hypothetical protein
MWSGDFSFREQENRLETRGLGRSVWIQLRNSGLVPLGGEPWNVILLNGVKKIATREIGAPGFQRKFRMKNSIGKTFPMSSEWVAEMCHFVA